MNSEEVEVREVSPRYGYTADKPAVPAGYKQTEVGIIPENWDANLLGRFWSVTDCKHITARFVPQAYPLASIREVQSRFIDLTNAKQTTARFYNLLIEGGRKPQHGDLILSRNATVGEVAQVAKWHPPFAMGQDVCLLRKKSNKYSTEFLQSIFESPVILNQLANLMVGSTFKRANVQQIRNFIVPMPPSEEQSAIATALSDVDALLEELDRLIAKKHDIKQATMQQLLTGQTRLSGFKEEWQTKPLAHLAEIRSGGTPSTSTPGFWNGGIPWCTPTDITALRGQKHLTNTERTISPSGLQASSAETIPPNSVIMTTRATIGECAINTVPMTTNQGFKNLVPIAADCEFLYYLMTIQKSRLVQLCAGSSRP